MKFSIVIPVYNVEKYLEECIGSVLSQTYQSFDIVLVDDGSTDGSGVVCDQYAERYPETIKVFHGINQGPHMARMQGIEHVSGDAVMFVDADDKLRGDTLEQLMLCFEETKCDMVIFNASYEDSFSSTFLTYPFEDGQCFYGESKKVLYKEMILNSNLNSLCLKAVKRTLLAAIPPECREFSGRHAEDLWLGLPLLTEARDIRYINQNLYYYRLRQESIVHSYNPVRHRSIRAVHERMEKYIDVWGMEEYHPIHYAREVRGWIECLKQALANMAKPDIRLMQELGEDTYFQKAYNGMERSVLAMSDVVLAKWLYQKKYGCILLAGNALRWIRAVKRLAKGNRRT